MGDSRGLDQIFSPYVTFVLSLYGTLHGTQQCRKVTPVHIRRKGVSAATLAVPLLIQSSKQQSWTAPKASQILPSSKRCAIVYFACLARDTESAKEIQGVTIHAYRHSLAFTKLTFRAKMSEQNSCGVSSCQATDVLLAKQFSDGT